MVYALLIKGIPITRPVVKQRQVGELRWKNGSRRRVHGKKWSIESIEFVESVELESCT
jgi:hypothetical protein